MGRHDGADRPHVAQDRIHLVDVGPELLLCDAGSHLGVGLALDGRRAEKHRIDRHPYVMQKARSHHVAHVHHLAPLLELACQMDGKARRLETVQGDVAVLAVVGNALCLLETLGADDVVAEFQDQVVIRFVHV